MAGVPAAEAADRSGRRGNTQSEADRSPHAFQNALEIDDRPRSGCSLVLVLRPVILKRFEGAVGGEGQGDAGTAADNRHIAYRAAKNDAVRDH